MSSAQQIPEARELKRGQDLGVVEAMKTENVLQAEHDGEVSMSLAAVDDVLAVDQHIFEFKTPSGKPHPDFVLKRINTRTAETQDLLAIRLNRSSCKLIAVTNMRKG